MGSFRSQLLQSWERTHDYQKIGVTRAILDVAAREQFLLVSRIQHQSQIKHRFFIWLKIYGVHIPLAHALLPYYCKHCIGNISHGRCENQLRCWRLFLDLHISFRLLRSILKCIRQVINLLCGVCVSENVIGWRQFDSSHTCFWNHLLVLVSCLMNDVDFYKRVWLLIRLHDVSVDFRVLQLGFIYILVSKCRQYGHLPNVLSSLQSWPTARSSSELTSTPALTYSKNLQIYLLYFLLLHILRCTSWFRSVCVSKDVAGVVCIYLLLLRMYLPILSRRLIWLLFCILG